MTDNEWSTSWVADFLLFHFMRLPTARQGKECVCLCWIKFNSLLLLLGIGLALSCPSHPDLEIEGNPSAFARLCRRCVLAGARLHMCSGDSDESVTSRWSLSRHFFYQIENFLLLVLLMGFGFCLLMMTQQNPVTQTLYDIIYFILVGVIMWWVMGEIFDMTCFFDLKSQ